MQSFQLMQARVFIADRHVSFFFHFFSCCLLSLVRPQQPTTTKQVVRKLRLETFVAMLQLLLFPLKVLLIALDLLVSDSRGQNIVLLRINEQVI